MNITPTEQGKAASHFLFTASKQLFNNDLEGAIESYSKAIEIDPDNIIALQGRAFCRTLMLDNLTFEERLVLFDLDIPNDLARAANIAKSVAASLKESLAR